MCLVAPELFHMPMNDRGKHLRAIEACAAEQFGVVSRHQALACGLTSAMWRRRVADGEWLRVLPEVVRFASAAQTFRQRAMSAVLWSAPDGMVSHRSAARFWEYESVARGRSMHLTVPSGRSLRHSTVVVHHGGDLIPADRSQFGPIAVTSALRTALDLAADLEPLAFEIIIEDGLRRGLFSRRQLQWRLAARAGGGFPGSGMCRDLLDRRTLGQTDSGWEVRLAALLVDAGFPSPERQLKVTTADGDRYVDLGYPGPSVVALEYDSDAWHSSVVQRHRDAAKRNALRVAGCLVIEVTSAMMRAPAGLLAMVAKALDEQSIASRARE